MTQTANSLLRSSHEAKSAHSLSQDYNQAAFGAMFEAGHQQSELDNGQSAAELMT